MGQGKVDIGQRCARVGNQVSCIRKTKGGICINSERVRLSLLARVSLSAIEKRTRDTGHGTRDLTWDIVNGTQENKGRDLH